ncbi:unnamed protein product, partial [Prorocentrum cordatum]
VSQMQIAAPASLALQASLFETRFLLDPLLQPLFAQPDGPGAVITAALAYMQLMQSTRLDNNEIPAGALATEPMDTAKVTKYMAVFDGTTQHMGHPLQSEVLLFLMVSATEKMSSEEILSSTEGAEVRKMVKRCFGEKHMMSKDKLIQESPALVGLIREFDHAVFWPTWYWLLLGYLADCVLAAANDEDTRIIHERLKALIDNSAPTLGYIRIFLSERDGVVARPPYLDTAHEALVARVATFQVVPWHHTQTRALFVARCLTAAMEVNYCPEIESHFNLLIIALDELQHDLADPSMILSQHAFMPGAVEPARCTREPFSLRHPQLSTYICDIAYMLKKAKPELAKARFADSGRSMKAVACAKNFNACARNTRVIGSGAFPLAEALANAQVASPAAVGDLLMAIANFQRVPDAAEMNVFSAYVG